MADARAQQIIRRFEQANTRIMPWKSLIEEVFRWMVPLHDPYEEGQPGEKRGQEVVDSTAVSLYQDAVGDLQFSITPPDRDWVMLDIDPTARERLFPDMDPGHPPEEFLRIMRELAAQNRRTFEYIRKSNFDTEIHTAFQSVFCSTGALLIQRTNDHWNPLRFNAVPLGQLVPEVGPYGTIETAYRRWKVEARNLDRMWPNARWSDQVQLTIREEPDSKVEILEATVFQDDRREWDYVVLEEAEPHIAVDDKLKSSPWVIFRMTVMPGEIMGRGPAMSALSDVKTLNQYVSLMLEAGLWAAAGAYKTTSFGLMNNETLGATGIRPRMLIPLMLGEDLDPLEMAGDLPYTLEAISDLRTRVKEILLGMNLPAVDGTVKTATEFAIRQDQSLRRVGPPFARVYSEFISPAYRRIRHILMEGGHLQPVAGLSEDELRVVPVSPLAVAARKADAAEQLQILSGMLQVDPNAVGIATDVPGAITHFLTEMQYPSFLFRSEEEQAEIEAAQAEVEAQQMQAQFAQQGGNGNVPLGEALTA